SLRSGSCIIEQPLKESPRFYRDIPRGRLRDMLKKLIKERALLDMGTHEVRSTEYEHRDSLDKIILRLKVTGIYVPLPGSRQKGVCAWLELHPLRGYEDEAEMLSKLLSKKHQFRHINEDLARVLFRALDKTPADYSSKMDIRLEHDMPGHSALSAVLLYNLEIMESNENGIKQDIDIEFLHDFRVANRRSRSLVTRVKHVFPESELGRFRKAFSWLSKLTSTHRDLDVFLADFAIYENRIPRNGGGDLEPLRELLQKNRTREHKRLVRALESSRFDSFRHDWRTFLESKHQTCRHTAKGMTPVMEIASKSIWKGYKKLLQQGDTIKTNYTFESIHQLRKDGKKLRYLLEAFRSLYPDDDISSVIGILKKLQNNLGDIVDMHTQRYMLEDWKQTLLHGKSIPADTIQAIDHLENLCIEEEAEAEKKFKKRFNRFSNRINRKLFLDLFA
ncbi:MAG TPA: CHAD domain-containing protein, partial [Gammaproteobacteria bacterium]|nr:CHAD domain-containing protein [Gammaproteobacteria bacterium]